MRIKFKRLYQAFVAYRGLDNLGDFALLKADALGVKTEPEIAKRGQSSIAKKMERIKGYCPQIELAELIQLPRETFGHEYALYMQTNKLRPLNISAELADIGQDIEQKAYRHEQTA